MSMSAWLEKGKLPRPKAERAKRAAEASAANESGSSNEPEQVKSDTVPPVSPPVACCGNCVAQLPRVVTWAVCDSTWLVVKLTRELLSSASAPEAHGPTRR